MVYEDEGFSGGNLNRPDFKKMMDAAKKRKFKAIIVYRLDRISRNISDFASLIEELARLDISFVSIKEQFDTSTPMGRAMMYIASVFSQLERETIEIIKMCISYVFRRSICDIPTNSLNKTFATLRNEIKADDYMNSIKAFFVLRDDYKEFPDDEKFEKAFVSRDIYNMRSRNFILSHLENFGNKAPIIIENYTIEHIMPQNSNPRDEWKTMLGENWKEVQKTYLHTIGNLTLTAYNSEMSDNPFMVKMDMEGGFKESALRLNAYLVKLTEWNEQHIKERAKLLAEKAEQIWTYPEITAAELAPYQVEEKPAQKYTIDSYDINAFTRTLFDMLDRRICNLSPDVKREFKKLYIAYKLDTNFVDIVVQKQRLRISLNMKFSEIHDPKGLCKDITGLGRWGNGDVEVFFEHTSEIDDVMELIEQSYSKQADE